MAGKAVKRSTLLQSQAERLFDLSRQEVHLWPRHTGGPQPSTAQRFTAAVQSAAGGQPPQPQRPSTRLAEAVNKVKVTIVTGEVGRGQRQWRMGDLGGF